MDHDAVLRFIEFLEFGDHFFDVHHRDQLAETQERVVMVTKTTERVVMETKTTEERVVMETEKIEITAND